MVWSMWMGIASAAGPHVVGTRDVQFQDTLHGRGTIKGRVYYPALADGVEPDPVSGPYPLVAFLHGWLGNTDFYDEVCTALSSEGFVVASIDTQTGLILDIGTFGLDAHALVSWVEAESLDPASVWADLVDHGDLIAMGHSMGGATLGNLVGIEPRVRTLVGFMPYEGRNADYEKMADYTGSALYLAGTHDTTSPTWMVEEWYQTADLADRSLFVEIGGAGHQAVTDLGWWDDGVLDPQRQLDLMIELGNAFVIAEARGEEDRWISLVGSQSAPEQVDVRSGGHVPVLWAEMDGDTVTAGVAGRPTGEVRFLAGSDPDLSGPSELGSATLVDGIAQLDLSIADWTTNLYLQAVVEAQGIETPSRTLDLITDVTEPMDTGTPVDPPPGTTPPVDTDPTTSPPSSDPPTTPPDDEGGGCNTIPVAPFAALWLLPLLRRRSRS